jgi:hypothetical protein
MRKMLRKRFPDDDLVVKITAREAFNAEKMVAYVA